MKPVKHPLLILISAVLLLPLSTFPHGGGLDGLGCHHNRKAGGYHCHRGELAGRSFTSKIEATQALSGSNQASPAAVPAVVPKSASAPSQPAGGVLVGVASVTDGDTLEIHGTRVRLHGIDAPESSQTCQRGGQAWRCGQTAALALSDFIGRRTVSCQSRDTDRYGRTVAVCSVGGTDINRWLVAEGYALAYRQYSTDYVADEAAAKTAHKGVWATEFVPPWEWRRRR